MLLPKISRNLAQQVLGDWMKTINTKAWLREAVPPSLWRGKITRIRSFWFLLLVPVLLHRPVSQQEQLKHESFSSETEHQCSIESHMLGTMLLFEIFLLRLTRNVHLL